MTRDFERLKSAVLSARATSDLLGLSRGHLEVVPANRLLFAGIPVWTDDYSDLMSILRSPRR